MKLKKTFIKASHLFPQILVLLSVLTSNVLFPAIAIAQEISDLPDKGNTVSDVPIDDSEDILDEGISTNVYEEENQEDTEDEAKEPLFVYEDGVYTVNTVVQDEEYLYPDNEDVRIIFNEVTEEGNLVIKRVELTDKDKEELNTTDEYAWDISSTMSNGSFKYDLTLPNTQGNDVEVKYTEDGNTYESVDDFSLQSDTVVLKGLDHFTIFVVTFEEPEDPSPSEPGYNDEWLDYGGEINQVPSGTHGITSAEGSYHAEITGGAFTRYGGYSMTFPSYGYDTKVDVYLDMSIADGSDKKFAFSSAINNVFGDHLRDFVFSIGTDSSNPGQWLISASNNAPGWPGDPNRNPVEITETGWYTLEHQFRENSNHELVVTMNIYKKGESTPFGTWVLSDSSDIIGSTVGGNRYGWFIDTSDFSFIAIDNSILQDVTPPNPVDNVVVYKGHNSDNENQLACPTGYTNDTQIRIEWDASTDPDIDYYWIGTQFNDHHKKIYAPTTHYDANITPGHNPYYYTVIAVDESGNESLITTTSTSCEVIFDQDSPDTPEITYPTAESYFNTTPILNNWTEITDPSGIAYYRVEYVYDDDHPFSNMPYRTTTTSQRNHTPNINEQGGVTIRVQAVDNAGNESDWSTPVHYVYDETNPTIPENLSFKTISGEVLGCGNGTTDYTIITDWDESTDDSPITYEYRSYNPTTGWIWNAGNIGNLTERQGSFTAGEGIYGFAVRAKDAAGNYSDWTSTNLAGSCQITYDVTAPLVSDITITKDGNPVTYVKEGDTINISATVIDNLVGVKAVSADFSYTDTYNNRTTPPNTTMHNVSGNTYEATFTIPSGWNEGDLYITVAARDYLDNYASNRPLAQMLIIDNTAPESYFTGPLENTYYNSGIPITGYSEDLNGVSEINLSYRISGSSDPWTSFYTENNPSNNSLFNWFTTWTPNTQGTYEIMASATDIADNIEHTAIIGGITYDTDDPTITNVVLTVDYLGRYLNGRSDFAVTADVEDPLSGINTSTCQFTIDGTTWLNGYYSNLLDRCVFRVSKSDLFDDQDVSIQVRVQDNAGNTTYSNTKERTIDKNLPQAEATIPNNYYGPNSLPEIKGTASDTVSDISLVNMTLKRSSDNKYWFFGNFWIRDSFLLTQHNTVGTNNWTYTGAIPSMSNGVTYTVKPYAWDQVHLEPGSGIPDSFIWDSQEPYDPDDIKSISHNPNTPSQNQQITIIFNGAHDYGLSGIDGYYYSFSNTPETPAIDPNNWLPGDKDHVTSPILDDGEWYFNIRTVDNVGNITSTVHSSLYIIDTVPANIAWNTPSDGEIFNTEVVLSASTNEMMKNFRFKWQLDGESWDDGHNINMQDTTYSYTFNPVEDGVYHLRAQGRDLALNWSKAQDITVTIDKTRPTGTITTPLDGEYVNGMITVSGSVDDNLTGIDKVLVRLRTYPQNDFRTPWFTATVDSNGNYSYDFDTSTVSEGIYEVAVVAFDNAGNNKWLWRRPIITIDRTSPVVEITQPNDNSYVNGSIEVRGSVTDINPDHYYLVIKNSLGQVVAGPRTVYRYDSFTDEILYAWDTTNFDDGEYIIYLAARDSAGNRDDSVSLDQIHVTIDNTAPLVEILNPLNSQHVGDQLEIRGSVIDDNLSHYNISIYPEGVNVQDFSLRIEQDTQYVSEFSDQLLYTWDTTNGKFPDGNYQIRLAARDLAGNRELNGDSEQIIEVTVDNTAPITTLEDISYTYTNQPILIEGRSEDALSDINYVDLLYSEAGQNNWQPLARLDNSNDNTLFVWNYSWKPDDEGTYDIKAEAMDIVGNQENSPEIYAVTYDTTPPSITLFDVISNLLSINSEDNLSEPNTVEVKVDNEEWQTYTSNINMTDLVGNEPGTYTIYIRVTDQAKNISEGSITYIIPEPEQEGETQGAATQRVIYAANTTDDGTGSGEEITQLLDENGEVAGESCENPRKVSGYVYLDKNKNEERNENEEGIQDVTITIYYTNNEGNKITMDIIDTDENGYWETELCEGTYELEIDQETLPTNTKTEDVLSLTVSNEDITFNIQALDTRTFLQKFWYLILIAIALLLTVLYLFLSRNRKEQQTM
jgi:hypothetical protein